MLIRSYRRVLNDVDRRIYRIDRWQIPVPGGIPLVAIAYFVAALMAVVALSAFPPTGLVLEQLSMPLRYVILPLAVAVIGTQVRPDGRPAHRWLASWIRYRASARRDTNGTPIPSEHEREGGGTWRIPYRWDPHAPHPVHARITGPARVTFRDPTTVTSSARGRGRVGRALTAKPSSEPSKPEPVELGADDILEVRS